MASGMEAISSTMLSFFNPETKFSLITRSRGTALPLFMHGMPRFGIFAEAVDFTDLDVGEKGGEKIFAKGYLLRDAGQPDASNPGNRRNLCHR